MTEGHPIIWITGQPGAGKSTVGRALMGDLKSAGHDVFMVDGDDLRALTANADYSQAGREANIRRAQDIALYLSRQGRISIVAVVAPFRWLREEFKARAHVKEVYVHTTEARGREHYHSDEYGAPEANYLNLDTTNISVEEGVAAVREFAGLS
ncbi:MAG: adenylyl-sulfate kinase [Flavobacteriales bacterium]|nr:adenylyl-sulfate kinase [Flavobacteriales bacterium]